MEIDLNRGVRSRRDPRTGVEVYMYKDTPGEYLTAHGTPVSEEFARKVGFPVEDLGKQKRKRELMEQARVRIEHELEQAAQEPENVLEERNGFKVIGVGSAGSALFRDPEGNNLTPHPVNRDMAFKLLDEMAGPAPEVKDPQPEPPEQKASVAPHQGQKGKGTSKQAGTKSNDDKEKEDGDTAA